MEYEYKSQPYYRIVLVLFRKSSKSKELKTAILYIICILCSTNLLFGQEKIPVVIQLQDDGKLPVSFKQFERPIEENELDFRLFELYNSLVSAGFGTASIDKHFVKNDTAYVHLFLGKQYQINAIQISDSNKGLLQDVGLKKLDNKSIVLNQANLDNYRYGVLNKLERNGYPYAQVGFENAALEANKLDVELAIEKGPYITFDSISNKLGASISKGYLKTYLGIREGRAYDEALVAAIDERLAELPFVKIKQPSQVWFSSDDKAHIEVFLEDQKVSKFDFLIGVLPNNANSGKVLVTGEAGVSLWNIFGTGKKIDIGWKRVRPQSQELNIYFDYPYILNTPLGADLTFKLDKQDTSFLDLKYDIGIQYLFKGINKVKVIIDNHQTFLLQADTTFLSSTGRLPNVLDQTTFLSGFEFYFENLNYLYNPRKGWEASATAKAGFKRIKQNAELLQVNLVNNEVTPQMLYDSLNERSAKFELQWLANYFVPLGKRQTIKIGVQGNAILNNSLLRNELERIGGNSDLRGFDEASIFTSLHNIMTLEYRYLLDKNAFFSLFFDWAYVEQRLRDTFSNDFPFGFGAGLNFETKAGIFGVSYALGRQNGNPIDFKSSKVHFGYVNIF